MTRRHVDDPSLTDRLLRCAAEGQAWLHEARTGPSWLRHARMGARVDWLLLHGATDAELDAAASNWRKHVRHLQAEHGLVVHRSACGLRRLRPSASTGPAEVEGESTVPDRPDPDATGDPAADAAVAAARRGPPRVAALIASRFHETARALVALDAAGVLSSPLLKDSVGMLIRRASECDHWHNSTDFRSIAAAARIDAAIAANEITTPADYQRWCRRHLRHEHVVPNAEIHAHLLAQARQATAAGRPMTVADVESLLRSHCKRATITVDEDRALARSGLSRRMPPSFWTAVARGGPVDVLERYRACTPPIPVVRRVGPVWFR